MARESIITRTKIGYFYACKELATDENGNDIVRTVEIFLDEKFNLSNPDEMKKALKGVRKRSADISRIIGVRAIEDLYEMSENEFIANATVVNPDERRNKVTKTITKYVYTCKSLATDENGNDTIKTVDVFLDENFNLSNPDEMKKALKGVRKRSADISRVVSVREFSAIFGMDENKFFELATYNPDGRKIVNK